MVTHESTRTFTPHRLHDAGNFLSKREPPKSRSNITSLAGCVLSRTLPPTFLFLQYSVVKDPTPQTRCRGPCCFWLRPDRVSLTRLSGFHPTQGLFRSELLCRQRRAALVGEAYIVGGRFRCQHRCRSFFEIFATVFSTLDLGLEYGVSLPQGQWFNPMSTVPQRSPIAAPLPANNDRLFLRGYARRRMAGGNLERAFPANGVRPSLTSPTTAGNCRGNKDLEPGTGLEVAFLNG